MKKICYGICGIGNGHLFRQLPILNYLAKDHQILIFTYGTSYDFLLNHFKDNHFIKIQKVWVPYYIGSNNHSTIDFVKTAQLSHSVENNYQTNLEALALAQSWLGKPDLVITDYEPLSAQYAYANESPLITFDQQSKYLLHAFPKEINGFSYQDEVMRLNMFFPLARRIATSFFKPFNINQSNKEKVQIIAPFIRDNLKQLHQEKKENSAKPNILVYLSEQYHLTQSLEQILSILEKRTEVFHLFLPNTLYEKAILLSIPTHCHLYQHGHTQFDTLLINSNGVITTAGHSLLSEAMYLNKPVYALPLNLYEQQLNAHIIAENHFGLTYNNINQELLNTFIGNIKVYKHNIENDKAILLKDENSFNQMIEIINTYFK